MNAFFVQISHFLKYKNFFIHKTDKNYEIIIAICYIMYNIVFLYSLHLLNNCYMLFKQKTLYFSFV